MKKRHAITSSIVLAISVLLSTPHAVFAATWEWNESSAERSSSYVNNVGGTWCATYVNGSGQVVSVTCFTNVGDRIFVKDALKDGKSAVGHWKLRDSSRTGACVNRAGSGKWVECNKDFPESDAIWMSAGYWKGGAKSYSQLVIDKTSFEVCWAHTGDASYFFC